MSISMDTPTESDSGIDSTKSALEGLVVLTKQSDFRLSGYEVLEERSGAVREPISFSPVSASPGRGEETNPQLTRSSLHGLKTLLASARNLAAGMAAKAEARDLIDLANSGYALVDALDELWQHRLGREPDWGDLVNLLRTAITRIEFERLSSDQCSLIARFVEECLCSGTVDRAEHDLGLRLLRKANLDPWRVLSGTEG